MKINAISSVRPIKTKTETPTQSQTTTNTTSFRGWTINGETILRASETEMKNFAEYFHKLSKESLMDISAVRNFLGFKKVNLSMEAYGKLKAAIATVITTKNALITKMNELSNIPWKRDEAAKLKQQIDELNAKADNCLDRYYDYGNSTSDNDSSSGDLIEDPVTYRMTHYD